MSERILSLEFLRKRVVEDALPVHIHIYDVTERLVLYTEGERTWVINLLDKMLETERCKSTCVSSAST